jgi:hypothetical protein
MLHIVKNVNDPMIDIIKDDPVRPEIPKEDRVCNYKEIIIEMDEQEEPCAAVCVSYQSFVPKTVEELAGDSLDIAVFYTIWSYKPGAGRQLIFTARDYIQKTKPTVKRFVTLSPCTDMARRFHLNNGAVELQHNETSVNYEYLG